MKKVYLLIEVIGEGIQVVGIFTSEKLAEKAEKKILKLEKNNPNMFFIEERETNIFTTHKADKMYKVKESKKDK